ncbi:hypothetical protein BDZ89DRAFT_1071806 [Hymenopellis radicata]|nr:hypothetical protein BDZ89DRAFT_1071806 [Hymenopellis radicata]
MLRTDELELCPVASEARPYRAAHTFIQPDNDPLKDRAQSAIQRLPGELLEAIFFQVHCPGDYFSVKDRPQWLLRQVCRFWRAVSTSSPRLWRELWIVVSAADKLRDAAALLRLALSYTREMGLFITFDMSSFATLLIVRREQWGTVRFVGLDAACTRALNSVQGGLPQLRELHIDSTPDARTHEEIPAVAKAPLLERLYVNGVRIDCQSLHDQLTRFSVTGPTYSSSLVSVLRECPRLKQLTMENRAFTSSSELAGRVKSETLKELTLLSTPTDLSLVHLPNLRYLDISGSDATALTPILPSILDLLKYSRCPLVDLRIVNCDLSAGNLIAVLELTPLLENLEIRFQDIVSDSEAVFIANVDKALTLLMSALGETEGAADRQLHILDVSVAKMLRRRNEQNRMVANWYFEGDSLFEGCW